LATKLLFLLFELEAKHKGWDLGTPIPPRLELSLNPNLIYLENSPQRRNFGEVKPSLIFKLLPWFLGTGRKPFKGAQRRELKPFKGLFSLIWKGGEELIRESGGPWIKLN